MEYEKIVCPKCGSDRFMRIESEKVNLSLDEYGDLEASEEEYYDVEYQCTNCDYWLDSSDYLHVEESSKKEECKLCGMVGLRTTLKQKHSQLVEVKFNCPNLDCGNHKEGV